ncbi:5-methylthioadenosine/S-adenosylhomocysteine deaminase [bacterium BMS3Bbin03]|nr:5-methylthioadenosine/S-adenosylhomocysteine deaminase [bacterium BMS3Bbin03]
MAIILKNATFIDWQSLKFREAHIRVEEGPRGSLEFLERIPEQLPEHEDTVLDCSGKLVTKAFGNAHHHVYSTLALGMPAPPKKPAHFYEILEFIWWRLDRALDAEMIEAGALAAAAACAKNGVTFVIDHHASPNAVDGSLETIARAFDRVGVSHLLCYELSDRDGESARQAALEETENYLKSGGQGLVGLHASFTVGDELLRKAVFLAEKYAAGLHVHVAEDAMDQKFCWRDYGKRVIRRFNKAGVLDFDKTILAHCLHIDDQEREIVRNSKAFVVQNTESNLNNNVGVFQSRGLGSRIMLGTDGMHSDMLRSAGVSFLIGQSEGVTPAEIYRRFREIHRYLAKNHFTGDGENNLVILNVDSPTEITPDNFLSHFVYGIESRHVESVIASGKLIVHQGKILTVNEEDVLRFSREMGKKLWKKLAEGTADGIAGC